MLDNALEESLEDVMVLGVFVKQLHVHSAEGVVLLEYDVDDFLELLVVLRRQAGDLDPLEVQLAASHHQGDQCRIQSWQHGLVGSCKKEKKHTRGRNGQDRAT